MQVRTNLWNQLGGNPAGSGFRLVNSTPANALRWISDPGGSVRTQSVVIGVDGTLYVGTDNGNLTAIRPNDGSIRWRTMIGGSALSVVTPAASENGTIYCLCTPPPRLRDNRTEGIRGFPSFVVAVHADGTVRWRVPIRTVPDIAGAVHPKMILGAPRVISGSQGRDRIVFVLRYEPLDYYEALGNLPTYLQVLAIVDQNGKFLLFSRYELERMFVSAEGGGGFGGGATLESPPERGLKKSDQPCEDTPVVFGTFPAREPWIIVARGRQGLYRFRWNDQEGALGGAPQLFKLPTAFPAPAAFPNGLLVGTAANSVTLLDAETFTKHVPNSASIGARSTAAGGLRQMYFATRYGSLTAVDSNGKVWKTRQLEGGSVAVPALSANHIHVSTAKGLETYTPDLEKVSVYINGNAGRSSPAIGPGGEVYLAAGKTLYAYFYVARGSGRMRDVISRLRGAAKAQVESKAKRKANPSAKRQAASKAKRPAKRKAKRPSATSARVKRKVTRKGAKRVRAKRARKK